MKIGPGRLDTSAPDGAMLATMDKPTIFFSHSGRDAKALRRLKDLFIAKTGGAIEVFLSSDGQSIPFGRGWIHRVEAALEIARVMFVFLSPSALDSGWVYFESGHAYAKKIRVVPMGMHGVRLDSVGPPLQLLQGFDLLGRESLDNIVAIVNEEFRHSHTARFTEEEAAEVLLPADQSASSVLAEFTADIHDIRLDIEEGDGLLVPPKRAVEQIRLALEEMKLEFASSPTEVHLTGMSIGPSSNRSPEQLQFRIDPRVAGDALPLADRLIAPLMKPEVKPALDVIFNKYVSCKMDEHKVSARLRGAARFEARGRGGRASSWVMPKLTFVLSYTFGGHADVSVTFNDGFDAQHLHDLLELLFERGILYSGESED